MAASAFDFEIERFIKPIRGLYKEYVTTIDDFMINHEEMMEDRIIVSDSIRDGFLVYEMFGDGEDGEQVRENVQTWICDNRMEVTSAVSTTLRAKKVTFGEWFRSSENDRSPDELIVYCLAKMSNRHTVIFNKSFCWSTLRNYMSYTDSEIVDRSSVLLIYVGVSKYAIIQAKPKIPYDIGKPPNSKKRGRTTKKTTPKKRTCRSNKQKPTEKPKNTKSSGRTLSEQRLNKFGIGSTVTTTNSRTRQKKVDYLKLNDGLEEPTDSVKSPTPKHRRTHLPSRSGPSIGRQKAQKVVTSPPAQVLATTPGRSKNGASNNIRVRTHEISGVQLQEADSDNHKDTTASHDGLSGVQTPSDREQNVSGVHKTLSGVHDVLLTTTTQITETELQKERLQVIEDQCTESVERKQADTDTLPDLVMNSGTINNSLPQNPLNCIELIPIGDTPPDNIFDGGTTTTEDEFDAVDALLSLSNARTNTSDDIEDNSTLMPVGGDTRYVDVNPIRVELDQVTVDRAIAQIVEKEQILSTDTPDNAEGDTTINGSPDQVAASNENSTEQANFKNDPTTTAENNNNDDQDVPNKKEHADIYNADTEVDESDKDQPKKGYVKLTTHGIKKKSSLEGRSYRCTICDKSKRSAHLLNVHHREKHGAQMCGICGKIFELASSLTHHMYSHEERRFYCNKCSFHSHFESELKKHKVTHHTTPQH